MPAAMVAPDGRVLSVNGPFAALLKGEVSGALGQEWTALLALSCLAIRPLGETPAYRFKVDGADRWFRSQGEAKAGFVLLVDATAEAALADLSAASTMRDALMQVAEVGTWAYDPDRDLYFFSSELAFGHQQAEDGISSATLQLVQNREDGAKDRAIRDRLTTEGGEAESEMRYRDANGGWRHLRVHYRSGRQTPSGRYQMYGISQNITEQARARDAANAGAQRLKLAMSAAAAGMFEFDYARQKFWFSAEYRALVGDELLRACRADPMLMFHPDDREAVTLLGDREGRNLHPDPIDVRVLKPQGETWVRLYYEITQADGPKPLHGVGLMIDVDAEKRLALELVEARRTAEAATAAKSDFLASVSHEIRTPMNGVVGILHLLKNEALTPQAASLLEEAIGCSAMLGQIINDVLDFSKMEAGKLHLSPIPTDPALILDSVAALIRPQIEAKGLYLRITAQPGMGWIDIDPVRLRQCLFNTIGNAAKFTAQGGVTVRMSLTGEGEAGCLRCEIEDTGIGIPAHAKTGLFDRFQQADSGTARKFGGTGLGLAISRSLARMMGGDMDFDSVDGQGSTFWFEVAAPGAEAASASADNDLSAAPLARLHLLVVDDNRVNRLVAVKSLEALGATAEAVESGPEALEVAGRTAFDIILMDVNMPGMDGLEATRRLRALGGAVAQIPVIAMTADVMTHHLERYRAAGMNGFVPKPFAPSQLLEEIIRIAGGEDETAEIQSA
jgi:signal transduction histidine kinase/CheY-like chemotaxis protein